MTSINYRGHMTTTITLLRVLLGSRKHGSLVGGPKMGDNPALVFVQPLVVFAWVAFALAAIAYVASVEEMLPVLQFVSAHEVLEC